MKRFVFLSSLVGLTLSSSAFAFKPNRLGHIVQCRAEVRSTEAATLNQIIHELDATALRKDHRNFEVVGFQTNPSGTDDAEKFVVYNKTFVEIEEACLAGLTREQAHLYAHATADNNDELPVLDNTKLVNIRPFVVINGESIEINRK